MVGVEPEHQDRGAVPSLLVEGDMALFSYEVYQPEIARQLLEDTEVPLGQITAALGYSETSAFTRAFRRWSGPNPNRLAGR